MIKTTRYPDESNEKFIKRFLRRCEKEKLSNDIRRNEYYESPSEKRTLTKRRLAKKIAKEKNEKLP